jgi:hypothetical protein
MKKQKPLNKKHYKDDYKYDKRLVSKEERRLADWELNKEDWGKLPKMLDYLDSDDLYDTDLVDELLSEKTAEWGW